MTKSLEKPISTKFTREFKRYKNQIFNSDEQIEVTDFGAGSKVFRSTSRDAKTIANVSGMSAKKAKIMHRVITYFQPNTLLEIGTSIGIGTATFKFSKPSLHIITMEGCKNTLEVAQRFHRKSNFDHIDYLQGDFAKTLPEALSMATFDLIYFDGNHQKKPTLEYFDKCLNVVQNHTIFVFDDIHWSKGMEAAWLEIKKHAKVTVTIDLFHLGLVFFKKELSKQDFII